MIVNNPIDLIKFEHVVFRIRFSIIEELLGKCDEEAFSLAKETHNFIVNWHARIEDRYIFPFYREKAKSLQNDHLLIEKYGNAAITQKRKDWLQRYIKIVLDHNTNEEIILFTQDVKDIQQVWDKILSEMKSFDAYMKITGVKII